MLDTSPATTPGGPLTQGYETGRFYDEVLAHAAGAASIPAASP